MLNSWGNIFSLTPDEHQKPAWQDQVSIDPKQKQLACGLRRSYGDVCLIKQGKLIDFSNINRVISFDSKSGVLQAEAGISLKQILELIIPQGWILPVLPGTQFVTLGGAIANDVHGKNHHSAGAFGCHVKNFKLKRSDQPNQNQNNTNAGLLCSLDNNPELFQATIGGLGLTGIITEATIQLKPIPSEYLEVETLVFKNLGEFLKINSQSEQTHEYTVAWLDCVAKNKNFSRGIYFRANFSENIDANIKEPKKQNPKKNPKIFQCFFLALYLINFLSNYSINFIFISKLKRLKNQN